MNVVGTIDRFTQIVGRGLARCAWVGVAVAAICAPVTMSAQSRAALLNQPATAVAAMMPADPHTADGPATRSARLTFFAGAVQVKRGDNSGEDTPILNLPLPEGTLLITGDYGQAEVEFEDGSVARLTPRSSLSIASLSLDSAAVAHTRLSLLEGLAYFELRKTSTSLYSVDAGGTQASPIENLSLRVNLDHPPALFAVLSGAAQIAHGEDFRTQVRAGETLRTDATDPARYFLSTELPDESWDQWNRSRDQSAAAEADTRTSARDAYAGAQGYGWSDLDASGTWYDVPGLGQVWQPAAAAGAAFDEFSPYDNGAWVWSGLGYVWASNYIWGWTPYRCGYWAFYPDFGWGWFPNASCGRWGFAGFNYGGSDLFIFVAEDRPPGRRPVPCPKPRPGEPHPILPVHPPLHAPIEVHPLRPIGGPVKILAWTAHPLKPVGGTSLRSGNVQGSTTLARDFPLDPGTHQPVVGILPGTGAVLRTPVVAGPQTEPVRPGRDHPDPKHPYDPPPASREPNRFPWDNSRSRPTAPVLTSPTQTPTQTPTQIDRGPTAPAHAMPPHADPPRISPIQTQPVQTAPPQAAPSRSAPVQSPPGPSAPAQSAPPRYTPAPQPAPTHSQPPPPPTPRPIQAEPAPKS